MSTETLTALSRDPVHDVKYNMFTWLRNKSRILSHWVWLKVVNKASTPDKKSPTLKEVENMVEQD